MKSRIIVAVTICIVSCAIAFVLQVVSLPPEIWSSMTIGSDYIADKNAIAHRVRWRVAQGHLVEGQKDEIIINLDKDNLVTIDPHQQGVSQISPDGKQAHLLVKPEFAGENISYLRVVLDNGPKDVAIRFDASPSSSRRFWLTFKLSFPIIALAFAAYFLARKRQMKMRSLELKLEKAESKAESEPDKAKPSWDLARVTLEAYFDKNLFQVSQVFWFAVIVMLVGFGFVLSGVVMSLNHPEITRPPIVAALSGIITQFIGATFLVIYKSTMAQA